MSHRIVTDSHGDRWDVEDSEEKDLMSPNTIRFRHQSGKEVTLPAPAHLNALPNRKLLAILREADSFRYREPLIRPGREKPLDPEGYITE